MRIEKAAVKWHGANRTEMTVNRGLRSRNCECGSWKKNSRMEPVQPLPAELIEVKILSIEPAHKLKIDQNKLQNCRSNILNLVNVL